MNKVYILFEITDMSNFMDSFGELAREHEKILGIYISEEIALLEKEKIKNESDNDEAWYDIREYEVEG